MDFGDGFGASYGSEISSRTRVLRLSLDPHGANSISLVYKYFSSAWNLSNSVRKLAVQEQGDLRYEGNILDDNDSANVNGSG